MGDEPVTICSAGELQCVQRSLDRPIANRVNVNLKPQAVEFGGQRLQHVRFQVQPAPLFAARPQIGHQQRRGARFYDTVLENLQIGLLNVRGNHQPRLDEVFGYFPALKSFLDRKGGFLSGGQQQQLAIARALVMQPKLLILDEPTEGIQPNVITLIGEVLENLKQRGNLAILLVEQYLDFATQLADRYYVMEKGAMVLQGNADEIDEDAIKPYLAF